MTIAQATVPRIFSSNHIKTVSFSNEAHRFFDGWGGCA